MSADVKETAAAIRSGLRTQFPGTRFSVRMDRGTAYGWISVSWMDGPTVEDVDDFVVPFRSLRFDTTDDSYRSTGHSEWTCCGVHTYREISPERMEAGLSRVFIDPEDGEARLFAEDGEVFEDMMCSDTTPRELVQLYYRHCSL